MMRTWCGQGYAVCSAISSPSSPPHACNGAHAHGSHGNGTVVREDIGGRHSAQLMVPWFPGVSCSGSCY